MIDTSSLAALLSGVNGQTTTPVAPAAPAMSNNPLANLMGLFNGSTDLGSYINKVAGGMSNMGATGGDPYLAFAQGFGGTGKYQSEQDAAAAKAKQQEIDNAMAANKLTMDQSQFDARMGQDQSQFDARNAQQQQQFDKDYALKDAAEKRQQLIAEQQMKKSAAEIERMARGNGITVDQQLQIERIAQAAGENIFDSSERKQAIDSERDRITKQLQSNPSNTSISDGPGITAQDQQPITATGPDGKKLVLKNGNWVPLQ
jgi:hypothetical protein